MTAITNKKCNHRRVTHWHELWRVILLALLLLLLILLEKGTNREDAPLLAAQDFDVKPTMKYSFNIIQGYQVKYESHVSKCDMFDSKIKGQTHYLLWTRTLWTSYFVVKYSIRWLFAGTTVIKFDVYIFINVEVLIDYFRLEYVCIVPTTWINRIIFFVLFNFSNNIVILRVTNTGTTIY